MKTTLFAVIVFLTATLAVMAQDSLLPGKKMKEDWFVFPGRNTGEAPLLIHMEAKASWGGGTGKWQVTQLHCGVAFQDGIGEHQLDIDFAEGSSPHPRISIRMRNGKYCVSIWSGQIGGEFPANPALEGYSVSYGITPVTTPVPAGEAIFCPAETRVKDEAINPDRAMEVISLAEGILAVGKTWVSIGEYEIAKSTLEPDARHLRRILNRGVWAVLKK